MFTGLKHLKFAIPRLCLHTQGWSLTYSGLELDLLRKAWPTEGWCFTYRGLKLDLLRVGLWPTEGWSLTYWGLELDLLRKAWPTEGWSISYWGLKLDPLGVGRSALDYLRLGSIPISPQKDNLFVISMFVHDKADIRGPKSAYNWKGVREIY